jgi:hypothetical protein
MITDVNPALLHLDALAPTEIWEGEGDGNSRPCLLVITGEQIQDATVTVAPTTANPMVMIVVGQQMVAPDHNWIAVEVTAKAMDSIDQADPAIPLTVTVTQAGADPQTLPWVLKPLDQFKQSGTVAVTSLKMKYSYVHVTAPITFTGTSRAIVVAMSSIEFDGAITASASGTTGGAGGCNGSPLGSKGGCAGGGGGGGSGGGGGGAGFSDPGDPGGGSNVGASGSPTGDPQISTYVGHPAGDTTANVASGGGGGSMGVGGGGVGGGGGGTVELTAGGDLTLGDVHVDGAAGGTGGGLAGSCGGGGGAGGVIVMRAGNTIAMHGVLTSLGGGGGPAGNLTGAAGGAGKPGRIRYDSAIMPTLPTSTVTPHRGISFVAPPTITTNQHPMLSLIGSSNDAYAIVIHDQSGSQKVNATGLALGSDGTDTYMPTLTAGNNEICAVAGIGTYTDAEAKTCIHVAFLPGAP